MNVAVNRPTWQSTDYVWEGSATGSDYGVSSRAVDGNRAANYSALSCSHTAKEDDAPWWAVDLVQLYVVYGVNVTNRVDCCGEHP